MKRIFFVLTALFLLAVSARAEEQTLFGSHAYVRGSGGPGVYYTEFLGDPAVLVGGQGGITLNKTFYIGLAGYGFATRPEAGMVWQDNAWRKSRFEGGYGGLMLGAILYSDRVVHGMADVMVGGGSVTKVINDRVGEDWSDGDNGTRADDNFFAVQPMLHCELNMLDWMRVDCGAGYRFVSDVEKFGLENEDVSGPVAGLNFRFGRF